jgi:hypothetical protein
MAMDLAGALVRLWQGKETPEDALLRFTLELEFVQCLANPFYLKCACRSQVGGGGCCL